jgi:bacterioferritin-associated ferredoxin
MFICSCKAITESQVRCLAAAGARPQDVALALGLDDPDCCGRCFRNLDRIAVLCAARPEERPAAVALAR